MKRISLLLSVVTAAMAFSVLPVLADEYGMGQESQSGGKDECLLVAMNCGNKVDTIQERINRIEHEISKGTAVYTQDELQVLDKQLRDANRTLNELMNDRPNMDI